MLEMFICLTILPCLSLQSGIDTSFFSEWRPGRDNPIFEANPSAVFIIEQDDKQTLYSANYHFAVHNLLCFRRIFTFLRSYSLRRFYRTTSWQLVSFPQITNLRYITCSASAGFFFFLPAIPSAGFLVQQVGNLFLFRKLPICGTLPAQLP
jgi:hypothetical protein